MKNQRTIKGSVTLAGIGLQTGRRSVIKLEGCPADSGINFIRVDLRGRPVIPAKCAANGTLRRTTISSGPAAVHTTEHLMAALSGLSIDNLTIEIDGPEVPGLDGSARDFADAVKKAGVIEQDAAKKEIIVKQEVACASGERRIAVYPGENFRISYTLEYKDPAIGRQHLDLVINEKTFEESIAPARTFCLRGEALVLKLLGFGKGANYSNTLVMGSGGPVKNILRFPDEPVRHKILDLMGDLYTLGMPIRGYFVANKSGHELNMELVRKLKEETGWAG